MTLFVETRRAGVLTPLVNVTDIDVPQINQWVGQLDKLQAVSFNLDAVLAIQGVAGKTGRNRAITATAARTFSSVSIQKRARFSSVPPYLSVRLL